MPSAAMSGSKRMTARESLERLNRVEPAPIWGHEEHDFTPWLIENLDLVAEAIGIDLELPEREVVVGDFRADIIAAEVGTDRSVIIENQLSASDHSHLGQLLTYAASVDSRALVWISPSFVTSTVRPWTG